ncbi:MAG: OmpA family protein [Acidimicrobiia bacterium]
MGTPAANLKLSEARAAAVAAWLTGKGIAASRLSIAGLGDTQPVGPNTTEEGRGRNRRVVLIKQ